MSLLPIALVLLTLPGVAQDKAQSWTFRVAALEIAGDHHTLWLRAGEGRAPVETPLNTHSFSPTIEVKGPAKLVFYGSEADASAKEPPPPLATATLKAKSSLLVFAPRKDGLSYQAYPIAETDFPFGSFRFVNLATASVRTELGRKSANLKPGAAHTFAYQQAQNALPVRILAAGNDQKPRVIRQSSWSIVPDQRELIFFFPNPANGLVRCRHFVDSQAKVDQPGN